MSWSPADDEDDRGNYPRFTRCAERCCTGAPLCREPEGDDSDD